MACFPAHLYGSLTGFATLIAFVMCLLSIPLAPLSQITFDGNTNYVLLIILAPTFFLYYLARSFKEAEECKELIRYNRLDSVHEEATFNAPETA